MHIKTYICRLVEYYWAPFPDCCVRHTSDADVAVRSFVTCVAAWAEKWTLATCVNILAQDEAVVRNIGTPNSELARSVQYAFCTPILSFLITERQVNSRVGTSSVCTPSGRRTMCVTRSPRTSCGRS